MEEIIAWVEEANDGDIDEIIAALLVRQKKDHPDWAGVFLSFPRKDPEGCRDIIINVWDMLRKIIAEEQKKS